jgi:hypothetical protein
VIIYRGREIQMNETSLILCIFVFFVGFMVSRMMNKTIEANTPEKGGKFRKRCIPFPQCCGPPTDDCATDEDCCPGYYCEGGGGSIFRKTFGWGTCKKPLN